MPMTLPARPTATLLILCCAGPALAYDSPEALIDGIYAPLLADGQEPPAEQLWCADTLKKLRALEKIEDTGLGFSPFVDGQDWALTGLRVQRKTADAGKAEMLVTFANMGENKRLTYDLRVENGGWCVNDITGAWDGTPWTVRGMLEAP